MFCSEIVKRAPSIWETAQWADCKFVVGAEPHQVVVGGYKLVMALASPVFEAMFYGPIAETRDQIPIEDVEPGIFEAMLQYMYTDKINISSWTEACELYYAAKKYMLDQLMVLCSEYLQTNLNAGNVCQLYEHSLLYGDDGLTQQCVKMFSGNTRDLLKDNSFTAADINTVTAIFSLDSLNLDSELDLIEAAARYAEEHDIKIREETSASPSTSTSMDEVDKQLINCGPSNLKFAGKQHTRSAVNNIRFLTLTPQQYANCAARYSLLTLPEDYAVMMNIVSDKSDVPMPSGFSTSRADRNSSTLFYFKIDDIEYNGYSQVHNFRKLKWQILAVQGSEYRNYEDCCVTNFSLLCTNESQSSIWSCDVSAELRIISQTPGVKPLICNIHHVFSKQSSTTSTKKFYDIDLVNDNYLNEYSIEMEVLICVKKIVGI